MFKLNYLCLALLMLTICNAQSNRNVDVLDNLNQPQLLESYQEYFEAPRESLYLHFNKGSYLRGENLWFQGYAYNRQTNQLNSEVRNVELRLYNSKGRMLHKKLYLSVDGMFKGQIPIDSTYKGGTYYIKAETQWMKNFNEDYVHIQQFEIIGSDKSNEDSTSQAYDVQILPEGGHSVENCNGVLGVKLINKQGLGEKFDAELIENDKVIFNFKSNRFGMAKVDLNPKPKREYKIRVNLSNGKTIVKPLTDIKPYGYDLRVNNILADKTQIFVSANLPPPSSIKYSKRQTFNSSRR